MSSNAFSLDVAVRSDLGKGASRRLRRQKQIPAILYGGEQAPQIISIELKNLVKQLENEAFYSHILTLNIAGTPTKAVLKALQRHPASNAPTHADFQRVDESHEIHMHVPLHFINEAACAGVKTQGGLISHQLTEVVVSCLPKNLPEYLEVDMADILVGQAVHLSNIQLPSGVKLVELSHGSTNHDLTVALVLAPRVGGDEEKSATTEEAKPAETKAAAKPAAKSTDKKG